MDVFLLSASVALSYALPVRGAFNVQHLPVKAALFLSFLLFSLSIIDATPSSTWLLVLTRSTGDHSSATRSFTSYRSVQFAYYVILWSIALMVLVVQPSIIGTRLCGQLFNERAILQSSDNRMSDDEGEKKKWRLSVVTKKEYPTAARAMLLLIRFILKGFFTILWFGFGWVRRFLSKICPRRKHIGPILGLSRTCSERTIKWPYSSWPASVGSGRLKAVVVGSLLGTSCIFLLLRLVAEPVLSPNTTNQTLLTRAVSLMVALGIVISSVLNGFGSVSMPYSCLAGLFLEPIRPEAIVYAETELEKALQCLKDQKASADSVKFDITRMSDSPLRRKGFSELGEEVSHRRKVLLEEVAVMESLVEEMKEDLKEMRLSQHVAAMSWTPIGMVRSWLGVVFSLILVLRLLSAALQALPQLGERADDNQPRVDVITRILLWSRVSSHDVELLSQFVSLLLTAFLSVSQVRYFLRTAMNVSSWIGGIYQRLCCYQDDEEQWTSRRRFHEVLSPIVAGCMGCYFLAANILTKMMLPKQYRAGFSAALGNANDVILIRADTLNAIFVASALVSGLVLGMRLGIQRQNTQRHQVWMSKERVELDP